tara:strand:- start:5499 stop:6557 length:1059 start_codon:yes stop_codon:yes gene_type:complete
MIEWIEGAGKVRCTEALELDDLPKGTVSRLLVEIARDALGAPIWAPVLVARGEKPGPVFGMTSALHGNELNGVPVIHRVINDLQLRALRGTVVGVVIANVPSYLREQRRFPDGTDLNHIMPGRHDGNVAEIFAYRLVHRILKTFNYHVDLHTASFGRINSLYVRADMKDPTTSQMAYLQRPQIILHNPASDHTFRGTAMELGIPSVTLEIGNPHRFQPEYVKRSIVGMRAILAESGMVAKRPLSMKEPPVLCSSSKWIYTDAGGFLEVLPGVTERLQEGQVMARLTNAFGDIIREYKAPFDGIVIGKNVNPAAQTGARILHLGVPADAKEHGFQERREWKRPKARKPKDTER